MATDGGLKAGATALRSYEDYVNSQKVRTPHQDLGKNDFLNILVSQMKHQDPMEPTSDTAFVAQLAQFSQLEQMNTLNSTMSLYQSYSLTGKFIQGEHKGDDGVVTAVAGFVKSVFQIKGEAWAQVGDQTIRCSEISQVMDAATATGENPLLENASLIGRYVEGKTFVTASEPVLNDDGTPQLDTAGNPVTRQVTKVTVLKGTVVRVGVTDESGLIAYLDSGEQLPMANIHDIRSTAPEAEETAPASETDETSETLSDPTPIIE